MMDLRDLLDACQAQALADKLSPTEQSVYEAICRSYSKMFHTPLSLALDMDPEHVVYQVYSEQLDEIDDSKYENLEKMLDTILSLEDPEYERIKNKKLEDDILKYELEEEERIRLGKPVHKSLENKVVKKILKSGGVDLSHLESEEN